MTHYNRKTYRIDDIDFDATPSAVFTTKGKDGVEKETSYTEYYMSRYGIVIEKTDLSQPLLVSHPRKKDINKGMTTNIYLLPSLCNLTGLSEKMRKDFRLMQNLSTHLHMDPVNRKKKLDEFMDKLKTNQAVSLCS
jgi:aubergine-like protein